MASQEPRKPRKPRGRSRRSRGRWRVRADGLVTWPAAARGRLGALVHHARTRHNLEFVADLPSPRRLAREVQGGVPGASVAISPAGRSLVLAAAT